MFGSKGTGKTSLVESTRLRIRPIRSTTQTIVTATPTQQPHTNKQEPFRAIFGALQSDDHDLDYIRNEMKKDGEKEANVLMRFVGGSAVTLLSDNAQDYESMASTTTTERRKQQ